MIIERNIAPYVVFAEDPILNALQKISANGQRIIFLVNESGILRRFHLQCLSPSSASILQTRKYNVLFSPDTPTPPTDNENQSKAPQKFL